MFNRKRPEILVVDGFYQNPNEVLNIANGANWIADDRYFKGWRTANFLFPYVKEEFERLLNCQITDWLNQPYNGCFQKTTPNEPLVYHSDSQMYAGAVYLTHDDSMGTSFYKDVAFGNRKPPDDEGICNQMFEGNLLNADKWVKVDEVGSVFNRLVLWNAKMIHSASAYNSERIVQLFFFNVR